MNKINNKGFTLIELLAVIVILAVVAVIGTTTVLPYMESARKDAFLIEATNVVKSAKDAVSLHNIGEGVTFDSNNTIKSCKNETKYCFTIAELIDLGLYTGDKNVYTGKVELTKNDNAYTVGLWFKKNDEFKIIGSNIENYKGESGYDAISSGDWAVGYSACSCS